jgi:hypothetical protein
MSARKYMNKAAVIRKDAIIHLFRQVLFRLWTQVPGEPVDEDIYTCYVYQGPRGLLQAIYLTDRPGARVPHIAQVCHAHKVIDL